MLNIIQNKVKHRMQMLKKILNFISDTEDVGSKLEMYKFLLRKLPLVNYYTLKRIVVHLAR